ncbi:hypothetical protein PV11_03934 [Exophiala sideris]|uniref:Uncharacterized protein n=1 Tax=Exophiala sideris TaxID=1016849 RepID=A0A0D1YL21_9EURO|nr:hypothetical protein PV11_03934 [Exophiala sideris]
MAVPARRVRFTLPELTIRYHDSLTHLSHEEVFIPTGFAQFLSKLTDVSAQISDKIKGVKNPATKDQGFTLADGSWWYRIARNTENIDANGLKKTVIVRDWHMLKTGEDFDSMCLEARNDRVVIEIEHAQQRARDSAPRRAEELKEALTYVEERKAIVEKMFKESKTMMVNKKVEGNELKVEKVRKPKNTTEKQVEEPVVKKVEPRKATVEKKKEEEPVNPSPWAIWEQWIWPPIIVDGSGTRRWARETEESESD